MAKFEPPQVECRLRDAHRFKVIFEGLKDMVKDVTFDFDPSHKMSMQAMDESRIVLISLVFRSKSFSKFNCVDDVSIPVNVNALCKIFNFCELGMEVDIFYGKKGPGIVSFEFHRGTDDIDVGWAKVLELDNDNYELPDLTDTTHVILPSSEFLRTMRDFSQFSSEVRISCKSDVLTFSIEGDAAATGQLSYHKDDKLMKGKVKEVQFYLADNFEWSQKFNLKIMAVMAKVAQCSEETALCLSHDTPFAIRSNFGPDPKDYGHLIFFIAGRVPEEE
eukprot:GEMP01049465.1.p1 GENE.GEMP01049465.1~~GEMP01049465.1.p1  ORF type:complete len:276 (+),score=47.89 GEMP01049465.1:57-884(+)